MYTSLLMQRWCIGLFFIFIRHGYAWFPVPDSRDCIQCHTAAHAAHNSNATHNSKHLQRYRALFALRNRGGDEAVEVLCEAFGASSALLKHEVAYVLGQLQHPKSIPTLGKVTMSVLRVCGGRVGASVSCVGGRVAPWR